MSVGFFWSSPSESPDTDERRGREILLAFHQASIHHPDYPYQSLEQLLSHYGSVGSVMAEGLGLSQRVLEMSLEDAKDLMRTLAGNASGRVPESWMAFNNALKDKALNPTWFDIAKNVGKDTLTEAVDIVRDSGEGIISTVKLTKNLLPILTWGGLAVGIIIAAKSLGSPLKKLDINKAIKDIRRK